MLEQAKSICIIRLTGIAKPTTKDINNSIDDALKIFPSLANHRELLYNILTATFSVFSEDYKILDTDHGYIPWIRDSKFEIKWNYWKRYESYLQKKLAPDTINKLNNLTDDILDRIANPRETGMWDKRGMVVGQVQSGKTGNYVGLINKAVDAGYKLIIVLAGMHDSLRSQTQIRIDEGFLGFNSQHSLHYSNSNRIGVSYYNPIETKTGKTVELPANSITSSLLNGDFNSRVAKSAGIHLRSTDPIIGVVKKNGAILKTLMTWLAAWGEKLPDGKIIIRNLPFLLIDDEADNASINVSKEKVSTINGLIRALLSLFEQSSYVGYTATPFANIYIPILEEKTYKGIDLSIKDFEFTVGQDLFPKDFIINIPAPSNYIGPAKVFGLPASTSAEEEIEPLELVNRISDYESFIPDKHKNCDNKPTEIPESLKYAIKCFILATAARRCRGQINVHNSMLVHVTRFVQWQDKIAELVDAELKFYQNQIDLNTGSIMSELKRVWENEFEPTTVRFIDENNFKNLQYKDPQIIKISWDIIKEEIFPAASKMEVRAVHGDKNLAGLNYHNISPLDYFSSENQGNYLSVIAVGGDKLSRGLTLEGLTISYYLRASKMYDTLMQMGRWFGFRPGYVDLCRIFTSNDLINWYKHITIASEEMRKDFDYMFLLKRTPKDYGLKIRTHPDVLKITAANKFRYKKIMSLSYSGELSQTYQFEIDRNNFKENYDALNELVLRLGKTVSLNNKLNQKQQLIWKCNYELIIWFLQKYQIGAQVIDLYKVTDYIQAQVKQGNLTNWTVALINNSTTTEDERFKFASLKDKVGLIRRTNISNDNQKYEVAKYNITDHRHELIDLSDLEISKALEQTRKDIDFENQNREKKIEYPVIPSRKRIKWIRNDKTGLFLIYPLNPIVEQAIKGSKEKSVSTLSDFPIIGIAISFPEIEDDEKIEYAVNEQFNMEYDYPDELDKDEENE